MRLPLLTALVAWAGAAHGVITWTLDKAADPTEDQTDAYQRIEAAMQDATARYAANSTAVKYLNVQYKPGVSTAQGSWNGDVLFGSNRNFMTTGIAMHEISHTLGVGQTAEFNRRCAAKDWPQANALLRSYDGNGASLSCGGGHFWPYGLNYDNEWSETNANRHVRIVDAMIRDGM